MHSPASWKAVMHTEEDVPDFTRQTKAVRDFNEMFLSA